MKRAHCCAPLGSTLPEWQVEEGIGERRALLLDGETPLAAGVHWPGEIQAGDEFEGKLLRKTGARGTAQHPSGREVLVDKLPRDASEGANYLFAITRGAMTERGRFKLPAARPVSTIAGTISDPMANARSVRRFPAGVWEDIWHAASSGEVEFAGGSLLFAVTPAMTLIDIDGDLPPRELSLAAVPQIAR